MSNQYYGKIKMVLICYNGYIILIITDWWLVAPTSLFKGWWFYSQNSGLPISFSFKGTTMNLWPFLPDSFRTATIGSVQKLTPTITGYHSETDHVFNFRASSMIRNIWWDISMVTIVIKNMAKNDCFHLFAMVDANIWSSLGTATTSPSNLGWYKTN